MKNYLFNISVKDFVFELINKIKDDDIFNSAAALAFYLLLSLFPAIIFLLSVLPYLSIENLDQLLLSTIGQILPAEAAKMFVGIISEVTTIEDKKLVSFGALATIWAVSNGMYEIMKQMNKTYDIKESRPFWKERIISILMTFVFGLLLVGALLLILFGQVIQNYTIKFISDGFEVFFFFFILYS